MNGSSYIADGGSQSIAHAAIGMEGRRRRQGRQVPSKGSAYLLDPNLLPRIESFGQNNDYTDVDEVVGYLRGAYREYQRRPLAALQSMVSRAISLIQTRGGPVKPELRLQAIEERHLSNILASSSSPGVVPNPLDAEDDASFGETSGSLHSHSSTSSGALPEPQVNGSFANLESAPYMYPLPPINSSLTSLYKPLKSPALQSALQPASAPASGAVSLDSSQQHLATEGTAGTQGGRGESAATAILSQAVGAMTNAGQLAAASPQLQAAAATARQPPPGTLEAAGQQTQGLSLPALPAFAADPGPDTIASPAAAASQHDGAEQPRQQQQQQRHLEAAKKAPSNRPSRKAPGASVLGKRGRAAAGEDESVPMSHQSAVSRPRAVRYADLGGIEKVLQDICQLIHQPLQHPEVYAWLGVTPPRGVLLHGPPGCGKTALAHAIANEMRVPFLRISAPEIVSGMSGESEAKLRGLFKEAAAVAPCIVFIDEVDAIAPKRESAQREMERRIVAQLLTCLDDLATGGSRQEAADPSAPADEAALLKHVVVIGATNRPDALDPALRRAGRFDREIALGIPTEAARMRILQVLATKLRLAGDLDFAAVASRTPGFVGADLSALTQEAAATAVQRIFAQLPQDASAVHPTQDAVSPTPAHQAQVQAAEQQQQEAALSQLDAAPLTAQQLQGLAIRQEDFEAAITKVQPSVRREGFATTPDVSWEDVGALEEVREEMSYAITQPIRHPKRFAALGLSAPTGVLLFGPPGCGKTLLAKAVANEAAANFMSIKGPELLNKWVGESERAVRQLFARARAAAPCLLFFDELDALAPRRGSDVSQSSERVVNQLLTEMDGVEGRSGVFVVAATNRPDIIDPALLRPGRLDKVLYVALPSPSGRAAILTALARRTPLSAAVDLAAVAHDARAGGFSGADLQQLLREASVAALKESFRDKTSGDLVVCLRHFEAALACMGPSVSAKDERMYAALCKRLRTVRAALPDVAALEPTIGVEPGSNGTTTLT